MNARIAAVAVACALASAQELDRVYPVQAANARDLQEIASLLRIMTGIGQVSTDISGKSIALRGRADQLALAEWLIADLAGRGLPAHEYGAPGDSELVRVLRVSSRLSVQEVQELAITIRVMTDLEKLFTVTAPQAVVMRGAEGRIGAAVWLAAQLDRPRQPAPSGSIEYPLPLRGQPLRVFYLAHAPTPYAIQELTTTLRTIGHARYVFIFNRLSAVVLRAPPADMRLAAWLVSELDQTPARDTEPGAAHEYTVDAELVRVFHLRHVAAERDLWAIGNLVRQTAVTPNLFVCVAPRAIIIRGTAAQVATAEELIRERDR